MTEGFAETDRIASVEAMATGPVSPDADQERRVAAFELAEESAFRAPAAGDGPYALEIAYDAGALRLTAVGADGAAVVQRVSEALARDVADYAALCEAYRDAVRRLAPSQIEALDQERRDAHSEASEGLRASLRPEADMDAATARRLFTLIYALAPPGGALGGV